MIRIRVLGDLEIEVDGAVRPPPTSRRACSLLGWLAVHPGPHLRSELAGRFWPDVLDASARANLRNALWALRSVLGPDGHAALTSARDRVGLAAGPECWIDAQAFGHLAGQGRLDDAVALCRGELLADLDDEWVLAARDEHRERLASALAGLASEAGEHGDAAGAVAWTRRWAGLDPLAEAPQRELMRCLADAGRRPEALAVYAKLRERLRRDLTLAPAAETRALAAEIQGAAQGGGPAPAAGDLLPLVGRDAELRVLQEAWDAASAGTGAVVVLTGEGGIGKSRLAGELGNHVAAGGGRVATCAALDLGGAAPFGLWAELAGGLGRDLAPPPEGAGWPIALAPLAPGLTARLGRGAEQRPSATPELERARLFEAAVDMVEWACHDRPLLLVLEDVHLADTSSLELAAYFGRRLAELPVLLALTRRDLPRRPEADALMQSLRARGVLAHELALAALDDAKVRALVREVGVFAEQQVAHVVAVAEGNPLLAVASARAIGAGDGGPPDTLREAVRARFAALDGPARTLAEFAAVAGRDLERTEAAALPVEHLASAALAALDTELLVAHGGRLGFRHALLRDVVYADLPEPRRAWLHETLAHALGRREDPGAAGLAAEIARHLRLAGRDAEAVAYLERAAAHARGVAALAEAAAFLQEVADLDPGRAAPLLDLAEVQGWRSRLADADAAFAAALERIDSADRLALAHAWLRRGRLYRGALCDPARALAAYRRALELLEGPATEAAAPRAEALVGCAWAEAVAGDPDAVEPLLRALDDDPGGGPAPPGPDLGVGIVRATALIRRGRYAESGAEAATAGAAAEAAGRPDIAYGAWINGACAAACAGDFERALWFADRGLSGLRGAGLGAMEVHVHAARAHILTRLERVEEATVEAEAEVALAQRIDNPKLLAAARHDRGLVALAAGDLELAAECIGASLDDDAPISRPLARLARAEALARLGRDQPAEAELRATALEPVGPSDFPGSLVPRLTRVQGLVAVARGDDEAARRLLEEAAAGWRRLLRTARAAMSTSPTSSTSAGRRWSAWWSRRASSSGCSRTSARWPSPPDHDPGAAMPSFHDTATTPAAPEEVWKALYDPARFPEWWAGVETVDAGAPVAGDGGESRFTLYPDGYPDFPMPQLVRTDRTAGRVTISCLVSDLRFEWRLAALEPGPGTRIEVFVEIPEAEAERLETQRDVIAASLERLARVAAAGAPPAGG